MNVLLQRAAFIAVFLLVGAYVLSAFRGPNGVSALMEKRQSISALQEQNATIAADNQRMADRIEKLKHDRAVQELEIRKRLKLLRPGETQFILPEQKSETKP